MQKHGVKTLNRDRDSLKEEQNLSVIAWKVTYVFIYLFIYLLSLIHDVIPTSCVSKADTNHSNHSARVSFFSKRISTAWKDLLDNTW